MENLIPNDGCVVTITKSGFIKRTTVDEFKSKTEEERVLLEVAER